MTERLELEQQWHEKHDKDEGTIKFKPGHSSDFKQESDEELEIPKERSWVKPRHMKANTPQARARHIWKYKARVKAKKWSWRERDPEGDVSALCPPDTSNLKELKVVIDSGASVAALPVKYAQSYPMKSTPARSFSYNVRTASESLRIHATYCENGERHAREK